MNELLSKIIASVIGVMVGLVLKEIVLWLKNRTGLLSGEWSQVITEGEHREDHVTCRHRGEELSGTIKRVLPETQRERAWKFTGKKKGSSVFLIFETTDEKTNPMSNGTIQLSEVNANLLNGFYIKTVSAPERDGKGVRFKPKETHLEWRRKPKSEKQGVEP